MSILAVPPEVQQLIIDELLRNEDLKAHAEQDEPIIIYHDLINWSCLHSYFRNLLAPYIFKTVKLVNDEKSGASLDAVARSSHRVHVENLHFIGSAPDKVSGEKPAREKPAREKPAREKPAGEKSDSEGSDSEEFDSEENHSEESESEEFSREEFDSEKSDSEKSDSEQPASSVHDGIFPCSVDGLLSNLQRFPSLKSLSIRFNHHYHDEDDYDEFRKVETPAKVLKAEAQSPWRTLMYLVYSALSRNKTPHVKHLDIRQLIRKKVSTFDHAAFHAFLGHFEQFTLSIHGEIVGKAAGEDHDLKWYSNATDEYPAIMKILDKSFFDHLAHVTILSIKAPREGPLGLVGTHYSPLALKAGQMPLLTTLHLEYVFVCRELIDFLVYHKDTLEEATLRNCYASYDVGSYDVGIGWSELFKSLWSAHPAKLCRFELVVDKLDLLIEKYPYDLQKAEADALRTLLQERGKILFPYANIYNEDGELVFDAAETWRAFRKKKDQRYWCRLQKLVDRNAMKVIEE